MDIYAEVTARIIAEMENGVIPWEKPWIASGNCVSHATGKPYSLLNQMLLGRPGEYVTFKRCQQEGGKVKKGEKSRLVVFWKWIEQEDEETGEKKEVPFLRYFNVFHIDQCEGLTAKYAQSLPPIAEDLPETKIAEDVIYEYLGRECVHMTHEQGDRAYYHPATDTVVLPIRKQFMSTAEYFSTAFHELVHSTGHKSRLDRLTKVAAFGSDDYSKEELIAEIGAAALVNHSGLETSHSLRNSAAYIQNWLQVLKDDIPITPEQWRTLMQHFPREHPSHMALNLGYHLGLRLGEAFGLMWEDVNFAKGTISIRRQVQYDQQEKAWELTAPKYESFRTISVDAVLLALLKDEHQRQQRAQEYFGERYQQVCVNERGYLGSVGQPVHLVNTRENGTFIQPRALQHTSRVIHKELNMPLFDFHSLRHTHTTLLLEAGANPLDVQERLGHSHLAITWRYAHNTDAIREQTHKILSTIYK